MPAYWIKPFGTTEPPVWTEPDWINAEGVDLDSWDILSGPSAQKPPMGRGDKLVFSAVGHSQLFGAGEILGNPTYHEHPFWKKRFPWVYPVRVDVWIPLVTDGPRLSATVSKTVLGRIQAGAPYAQLTVDQYNALIQALLRVPSVQQRPSR